MKNNKRSLPLTGPVNPTEQTRHAVSDFRKSIDQEKMGGALAGMRASVNAEVVKYKWVV